MPVLSMPNIQQLSNYHTYQAVCSEVMTLTHTDDNERSQLSNIRTHINMSLSYLSNLLNLASSPWYLVWMQCQLEANLHISGLPYIDLSVPVVVTDFQGNPISTIAAIGYIPARQLIDIKRGGVSRQSSGAIAQYQFKGNLKKMDLAELLQVNSQENIQHRHTIAWSYTGQEILLMTGSNITVDNLITASTEDYVLDTTATDQLVFWGTRKPLLDDLLPLSTSLTYTNPVDIPDEYIWLLVKLGQKATLEQLNQIPSQQLEAEINQGVATITQMISTDMQLEAAEREKRKYGQQQRPPGAV